jgi:hypothetical protein
MPSSYTISPLDSASDREPLLALWRRNLPCASPDRYDWLYARGPAAAWLLEDGRRRPVGASGLMARTIRAFGSTIRGAQAIDLNVDRDHRTIGPALRLQRAVTATVDDGRFDLIYAFPNAESEPVQRRAGYKTLGHFGRWVKPLRLVDGLKGFLRYPRARRTASAVVDLALRLRSPDTFHRRPDGVQVEVSDRFDGRFDALWEEAAGQFGVIGQRTARYLDWRFYRSPAARHRVFSVCDGRRRLLAYLVYSLHGETAYVSDFLFGGQDHLDLLLAEFIRQMRREKTEAIVTVFLGAEGVCRRLAHFGFLRRPSAWKTLVYADRRDQRTDSSRLWDQEAWFLTRADVDTDF